MKKIVALVLVVAIVCAWGGVASAAVGGGQGTYTIGYWKTHTAELGAQLPVWLGDTMIRTTSQAVSILKMTGGASNGIVKLKAQLLAATLNNSNGASLSAVQTVVDCANDFLTSHDTADWATLTSSERSRVLSWMNTLDKYNNGVIGPGHAD